MMRMPHRRSSAACALTTATLILCGCSGEQDIAEQSLATNANGSAGSLSGSTVTPSGASPGIPADIPQNWAAVEIDVDQAYQDSVTNLREMMEIPDDLKAPGLVRFIQPTEYAQVTHDCLQEKGFPTVILEDNGIAAPDTPLEQQEAFNLADFECAVMYPVTPYADVPLPLEAAEQLYVYWAQTTAPCLREQGVTISDPPTRETWIAQYYATGNPWNPFNEAVANTPVDQIGALYRQCPSSPPDLYPPVPAP